MTTPISPDANRAPDANPDQRPGNPKEREPQPLTGAKLTSEIQSDKGLEILREPSKQTTALTFGSQHEPTGLSGVLRRAAYKFPDYQIKRWALLIAADRVQTLEHSLSPRRPLTFTLLLAGAAAAGIYYFNRSKPASRFARWL